MHNKLNSAIQEVSNYYGMLEEREKQALRSAMIEERSHFCTLFTFLKPMMVGILSWKWKLCEKRTFFYLFRIWKLH